MVDGIVDNPENLETRFGISRRLAVRIAALAGFGTQVTGSLLEDVASKPTLRTLLLSDELFQAAKEGIRALRSLLSGTREIEIVEAEGGAVLALAEELIAERVLPPALSASGAPILRPGDTPSQHLPLLNEVLRGSGGADEAVRGEKIRFLTSPGWKDRLEALRKILVLSMPSSDKAGILFFALRDEDHRIISEAIKAFKEIGLSRNTADALIELIRGDGQAQKRAADFLLHVSPRTDRKESDILVAVTARLVRDDAFLDVKAKLFKLLRTHLRGRENTPREIREIVRILTQNIAPLQEDAQLTLRDLLLSMGKGTGLSLCEALWEEVEAMPWGSHRTFVLGLLARTETRSAQLQQLDMLLLREEIPKALEKGYDLSAYRLPLLRRFKVLFGPLLELAEQQSEERRSLLFRLLGDSLVQGDLKPGSRSHRAKMLLSLAERSGKSVRRALLRTRVHQIEDLPRTLRRRFASFFLSLLEPEFLPQHNREIWRAVRDLGWLAADALAEFVEEDANDARLRKQTLAVLWDFLEDEESFPATLKEMQGLLRRLETLAFAPAFSLRNDVTPLLGLSMLNGGLSRREVSRIATQLVRRLSGEYTPGDVGALPFLARSPRVPAELKRKMVRRLLKILDEGEDKVVARETAGEEGIVLEMGKGSTIHTQQLPAAIVALKEAALALAPEDQGTTYMIGRTFMRQWEEVAAWKKVWGGTSRAELVLALGEMARFPGIPPSLAAEIFLFLVKEFFARPHELHLASAVTLPLHEGRFPKSAGIALRLLKQILAIAQDSESVGPDEAALYHLAAARIVSAPGAPVGEGEGKALASHLLDLLEQRIQLGFDEDGEALHLLSDAPAVQKAFRDKARYLREMHVPKGTLEDV